MKTKKTTWEKLHKKHGNWKAVAKAMKVSVSWLREIRKGRTTAAGDKTLRIAKTVRIKRRKPKARKKRLQPKKARREEKRTLEVLKDYRKIGDIERARDKKRVNYWVQTGKAERANLRRGYHRLLKGKFKTIKERNNYIKIRNKAMRDGMLTTIQLYDQKGDVAAEIQVEGLLLEESWEAFVEFEGKPIGEYINDVFDQFARRIKAKYTGTREVRRKVYKEGMGLICESIRMRHSFS